jgi:serine/threonine protein kinase
MALASRTNLVEILEQGPFLQPAQLDEVKNVLQPELKDSQALAKELVRRGWLTHFQARFLVNGRPSDLLLGPYLLLDRLGAGGVGQVYKAWHQPMKKVVAIKVLRPHAAKDREAVDRFYREIELASQVSHPNIVYAYEAGPVGNLLVLALEYVEGITLEDLVKKSGPLPLEQACAYIRQAAAGLQYAHERGLIHRDIKPSNLLLARSAPTTPGAGSIKILDLGLARLQQATGSSTANLTVAGGQSVMQGTPDYMAPEQALDFHLADIRADIYSLGCTFFFLLTGQPPFSGRTLAEKLMKHQTAQPAVDRIQPAPPPEVTGLLLKMLAKDPAQRPQTPGEVERALQPFCPAPNGTGAGRGSKDTINEALETSATTSTGDSPMACVATHRQVRRLWLALAGLGGAMAVVLVIMLIASFSGTSPAVVESSQSSPTVPEPRPMKIGSYRERFQPATPATGWQYLWNAKGAIGNPAHYQPLLWSGNEYNVDGKGPIPRADPGAYLRLVRDGGHPGRGAQQSPAKIDYYAIAAHTIQPADGPGYYRLANTSLRRGNGLEILVHLGGRGPLLSSKVPKEPNPAAVFDSNIGLLAPGDTVYVAVGPDGNDGDDSFTDFDFSIIRESGPTLPPGRNAVLLREGFENPAICWQQRSKAQFSVVTTQPHQGSRAFQIVVAPSEPLAYQQLNRVVEENPQTGDTYRLSAWVRTQNLTDGDGAYGYIEFVGDKEKRVGLQHTKVHIKNGAKDWEQLVAQASVPAGTIRVRVGLVLHSHGTAWFDDVEVTRESRSRP